MMHHFVNKVEKSYLSYLKYKLTVNEEDIKNGANYTEEMIFYSNLL